MARYGTPEPLIEFDALQPTISNRVWGDGYTPNGAFGPDAVVHLDRAALAAAELQPGGVHVAHGLVRRDVHPGHRGRQRLDLPGVDGDSSGPTAPEPWSSRG